MSVHIAYLSLLFFFKVCFKFQCLLAPVVNCSGWAFWIFLSAMLKAIENIYE